VKGRKRPVAQSRAARTADAFIDAIAGAADEHQLHRLEEPLRGPQRSSYRLPPHDIARAHVVVC